ncbi:glycosyltransferase [Sphaerisporangium flaviroseum]|uniref:Glycosyltransferase n=1 Tax=Sphaerisporangium flaviroseum TaxID=509199 RepID=A0ABP7I4I9_9ACTN
MSILAFGSRGDTQPCAALGLGLRARGHQVTIVAPGRYAGLVDGLRYVPISVDPVRIMESEEGRAWSRGGVTGFLTGFRRIVEPLAERLVSEVDAACAGTGLVLAPALGGFGQHMSERHAVPHALLHFQPSEPTKRFPNPLVPLATLGALGNRASYALVERLSWLLIGRMVNRLRGRLLGLGPTRSCFTAARRSRTPVLCGVSPAIVARPADWPAYVHLTGSWHLDLQALDQPPPPALAAFLDAGSPPVYVGFGSMAPADPDALTHTVVTALRRAGLRGVLQGLPPGPYGAAGDLCFTGEVPHGWLFRRMAAVVHHGGAGTTAAGLRAGVPSVICPFFSDQPFWGARVASLGAGPPPVPIRKLTVPALERSVIRAVQDDEFRGRSRELGKVMRGEDGVGRACEALAGQGIL